MWESFIRHTKTLLNYEKIITARMHVSDNDDVDNKTSDEMTRKMGNMTNSCKILSIRFEAIVTEEVADDASL
jgi:hypothetical protein